MRRHDAPCRCHCGFHCFLVFLLFQLHHLLGSMTWPKGFHLKTGQKPHRDLTETSKALATLSSVPNVPKMTWHRDILHDMRCAVIVEWLCTVEWSWCAKALRSRRQTHALLLLSPVYRQAAKIFMLKVARTLLTSTVVWYVVVVGLTNRVH